MTTVWACEKTVVMVKQPGHLTSMKKERGWGTRVCCEKKKSNQSWDLGGRGGVVCSGYVATYLELVLTGLSLRRRVEEVDRENLLTRTKVSYLLLILQFAMNGRSVTSDGDDDEVPPSDSDSILVAVT